MDVNHICLYSQQLEWFSLNIWGLSPSQDSHHEHHDSPLSHQHYSKERCTPGIPSWRSDSIFLQQLCYSWLSGSQATELDFKLQLTDVEEMTFFFKIPFCSPSEIIDLGKDHKQIKVWSGSFKRGETDNTWIHGSTHISNHSLHVGQTRVMNRLVRSNMMYPAPSV